MIRRRRRAGGAFDSELSIQAASPTTWRLLAPLIWTGTQGDTFTVPTGFETDFATVPRFLHWLVSPYGAYTRAAVLHDWLLVELAARSAAMKAHARGERPYSSELPPANSRDTDGIFRKVMEDLGVPWSKRWTMWSAVRVASLFNSRRAYGRQFWRDAPRVLAIGLPALPLILPGAVGVVVSLTLVRLVTAGRQLFGSDRKPDVPAAEE